MNTKTHEIISRKNALIIYNIIQNNCSWKIKIADLLITQSNSIKVPIEFIKNGHKEASNEIKTLIEKNFKNSFEKDNINKLETSYSNICKKLKTKVLTIKDFSFLPKDQREKALNYHRIKNIELYFNDNWKPNYQNSNEYKYFPWFNLNASDGLVGFGDSYYHVVNSGGVVAVFKSKEISDHVGKTFWNFYQKLI